MEQIPTADLAGTREEVKKDESIASKMRVVCIAGNQYGIRWMFQEEALCYFDRCVFSLALFKALFNVAQYQEIASFHLSMIDNPTSKTLKAIFAFKETNTTAVTEQN